jgi:uncharacterized protein with FMN-binding domain
MNLKKIRILILVILLTIGLTACISKKVRYQAGSYEGVGEGHHGPIKVLITTDQYEIKEIKIIEEYEMPELSEIVYDKIPKKVMKVNSAEVDVVAGATYTSEGLIEAIADGLNKAEVQEKNNQL